ncbi:MULTISPECIES: CDP-glycerol glycerophosphotransferase family protein [Flavobacterium]|uniref:CDP-glycerol glycerophosphotransferase family protein n=1 Tax=Flavobacterium TaxID=237 RepID=UPI001FCAA621|nr:MULTISPECIES: CDP-glycerol glycerophosphotransferase family protein [Flavobacterium]UOK43795.1 CDP-glycerol glycerophosphotransferase family protein [Flavobacterium enshiense]
MSKNKLMLLFPDGVGIRNYLYSDIFRASEDELILFHNFDDETEAEIKKITNVSTALKIPKYFESAKEKFIRELICISRLHYNTTLTGNRTILTNWKTSHKGYFKKIFYKVIAFSAPMFKKYESIAKLEIAYQKEIRKNPFYFEVKKILEEVKPDKLFCSHQRGLQCATVFAAAKDLGIETTTVIYSWDNLPKARMALRADKYLVWSEYMKAEMKMYYPEIPQSKIHITGTPQFECYDNPENIIPKEEFYSRYNLDLNKKIICYSGDDSLTSPDDPQYLEDIANEILKHGLDAEYQILLRRCPVDLSGRFDSIIQKYNDLIKEAPPIWLFKKSKDWNMVYPSREDISLLVSTAYYSDMVINVGSTMAFDFAMFGKPCIFIKYDQRKKNVENWSVETIYQFQHFRSMPAKEAVIWLNNSSEITKKIVKKNNVVVMAQWKSVIIADYKNASSNIRTILKLQ